MAITLTGKTVEQLKDGLDKVQERIEGFESQSESLQADLDGYETEGYEYFKEHVLPKELHRLDEVRRTKTSPTDQFEQCRIDGQQQECARLMKAKDSIEQELHVCLVQLLGAKRERNGLQAKLTRRLEHDAR